MLIIDSHLVFTLINIVALMIPLILIGILIHLSIKDEKKASDK